MGWAIANGPAEQYSGANTVGGVVDVEYLIAYHDGVWEQRTAFIHPRQEPAFDLLGLAMRSASDGWAVGSQGTLIHYGGGQWRQVHGPTTRDLYAVTQVGAADGWAVGDGAILHLTGGRWSVAALSAAG
jgi:hypothetical protein